MIVLLHSFLDHKTQVQQPKVKLKPLPKPSIDQILQLEKHPIYQLWHLIRLSKQEYHRRKIVRL